MSSFEASSVRPALEEVLALDRLCLRAPDGSALDEAAHRASLERSAPRSEWAVVRRAGVLVAYGCLWPLNHGAWFVGGLAIEPRHRVAPVVGALGREFLALAHRLGVVALHSHVLRNNAASLRLHRRLGFTVEQENDLAVAFAAKLASLKLPG